MSASPLPGYDLSPDRDLSSWELWDRSLERSRRRRELAEPVRRNAGRRKRASLALSAAMAASPVVPAVAGAMTDARAAKNDGTATTPNSANPNHVVLSVGSSGELVAALQRRLNTVLPQHQLTVDGIYGWRTRAVVADFQLREQLPVTGEVDADTWALLFNAPVIELGAASVSPAQPSAAGKPAVAGGGSTIAAAGLTPARTAHVGAASRFAKLTAIAGGGGTSVQGPAPSAGSSELGSATPAAPGLGGPVDGGGGNGTAPAGQSTSIGAGQGSGNSAGNGGTQPQQVAVVSPPSPQSQSVTYALVNGVALPLPRQYLTGGSVDQGVDYAAPGGTPLYAMGNGVIVGAGINGFGPNAPILRITSGPLAGMRIYYGHSGPNLVRVGQHVRAGQQISAVGYGIVGISTGPHLEVGFYPPGGNGAGAHMLSVINQLMSSRRSVRSASVQRVRSARVTAAGSSYSGAASTTGSSVSSAPTSTASAGGGGSAGTTSAGGGSAGGAAAPASAASAPASGVSTSGGGPAAPSVAARTAPGTPIAAPVVGAAPAQVSTAGSPSGAAQPAPATRAVVTERSDSASSAAPSPPASSANAPVRSSEGVPVTAARTPAPAAPAGQPSAPAPGAHAGQGGGSGGGGGGAASGGGGSAGGSKTLSSDAPSAAPGGGGR